MVPRIPLILLIIVLLALPAAAGEPTDEPTAVVLTYHIVESPSDTFYSMSREAFRLQIDYLRETGYTVIPLADLVDYVAGRKESIPRQSVVITVDDGWKCTYTEIYPLLQEMGLPFTVFLYPKFIGASYYALTWDQVVEMSENGVDIQSHSNSHPFLTKHSDQSLRAELVESRRILEKKTGKPVRFLAYPYGDYNTRVAKATEEAGYDAGLTCDFGPVQKESNPFRMKRVVIYEKTTFAEFRKLVGAEKLGLVARAPEAGGLFDPHQPIVAARIDDFEALDPSSVRMTVLGMNQQPYSYDPRDGSISLVMREPLGKGHYRAAVWGIDRRTGTRREAVWSFHLPEGTDKELVVARTHTAARGSSVASAPSPPSTQK